MSHIKRLYQIEYYLDDGSYRSFAAWDLESLSDQLVLRRNLLTHYGDHMAHVTRSTIKRLGEPQNVR